jgi:hypothetical protein
VVEHEGMRGDEAARLADRIVVAYDTGEPYLPDLAELCALCEDAGLDHDDILDDATRRRDQAD